MVRVNEGVFSGTQRNGEVNPSRLPATTAPIIIIHDAASLVLDEEEPEFARAGLPARTVLPVPERRARKVGERPAAAGEIWPLVRGTILSEEQT